MRWIISLAACSMLFTAGCGGPEVNCGPDLEHDPVAGRCRCPAATPVFVCRTADDCTCVADTGDGGADAGVPNDADVAPDARTCVAETCNGEDDDCDGTTDEGSAVDECVSGACDGGSCAALALGASISGGWTHSCARRGSGVVACWGRNSFGELGTGATSLDITLVPTNVAGVSDVVDVAASAEHTCVLDARGSVSCWGRNEQGQVGDGTMTSPRSSPVEIAALAEPAHQIATGGDFSCARLRSGSVACWGANTAGQLGNGLVPGSSTPVAVVGIDDAVDVACASGHGCAVRAGGTVACWGWNVAGQLGNGSMMDARMPVTVGGVAGATQVAAGGRHTCALVPSTNSIQCWGLGTFGQLGSGAFASSTTPIVVTGLPSDATVRQITAGGGHTCALLSDGSVYCWGLNDYGQLGDGTTTNRGAPREVMGLDGMTITEVRSGDRYACARTSAGSAYCWGYNLDGGLGDGTTVSSSTPVLVSGL